MLIISGFGRKNLTLAAFAWSGTFFPLPNLSHLTEGLFCDLRVECLLSQKLTSLCLLLFYLSNSVGLSLWTCGLFQPR